MKGVSVVWFVVLTSLHVVLAEGPGCSVDWTDVFADLLGRSADSQVESAYSHDVFCSLQ